MLFSKLDEYSPVMSKINDAALKTCFWINVCHINNPVDFPEPSVILQNWHTIINFCCRWVTNSRRIFAVEMLDYCGKSLMFIPLKSKLHWAKVSVSEIWLKCNYAGFIITALPQTEKWVKVCCPRTQQTNDWKHMFLQLKSFTFPISHSNRIKKTWSLILL